MTDINEDQLLTTTTDSENDRPLPSGPSGMNDNIFQEAAGSQRASQPSTSGMDVSQPSVDTNDVEQEETTNDVSAVLQKISPLPDASKRG